MPVDDFVGSKAERRRLWMVRLAATYCASLGVIHLLGLALGLYQSMKLEESFAPWWFYALSCLVPLARVAAGSLLFLRSTYAVPASCVLALVGGAGLFGGPMLWEWWTGSALELHPLYAVLGRADFVLSLVVAWATFKWRAQGVLRPGITMEVVRTDTLEPLLRDRDA